MGFVISVGSRKYSFFLSVRSGPPGPPQLFLLPHTVPDESDPYNSAA